MKPTFKKNTPGVSKTKEKHPRNSGNEPSPRPSHSVCLSARAAQTTALVTVTAVTVRSASVPTSTSSVPSVPPERTTRQIHWLKPLLGGKN